MLKALFSRLRTKTARDFDGAERVAYQKGYASEDTGSLNPHPKGSDLYKAWKVGKKHRDHAEMQVW